MSGIDDIRIRLEMADETATEAVAEAEERLRTAAERLAEGGDDSRWLAFEDLERRFTTVADQYERAATLAEEHARDLVDAIATVAEYWRARAEGCRVQSEILQRRHEVATRLDRRRAQRGAAGRAKDERALRRPRVDTQTKLDDAQRDPLDDVARALYRSSSSSKLAGPAGGSGTGGGAVPNAAAVRNLLYSQPEGNERGPTAQRRFTGEGMRITKQAVEDPASSPDQHDQSDKGEPRWETR